MKKQNIFNRCKVFTVPALISIIILSITYKYIDIIQSQKEKLETSIVIDKVSSMKENLSLMITAKQKATVAIALSLAADESLVEKIENKNIKKDYYAKLISEYKSKTLYKNVWIQILDKDLKSLYRSWNNLHKNDAVKNRSDLIKLFMTKKLVSSISSDNYDLSIKALVPILKDDEIIGVLEVISHFNSIAKVLEKSNIESVIVLDKENSKLITNPFTKIFIDDYYVANNNARESTMSHLRKYGPVHHFNDSYVVEDGYLVVSYPIKDVNGDTIAYYIMFEKKATFSSMYVDYFMFKSVAIGIIALMLFAIFVGVYLFMSKRKQSKYYKKIIDSSENIVIIHNKEKAKSVNSIFFDYFPEYKTLEEFSEKHNCICDLFDKCDDYLQCNMDGLYWIDYLLQNSAKNNRAKITYLDKLYYFSVSASLVSEEENSYAIVFTNITEQEKYKNDLELLTVTDPLSGIHNRRYFQLQIEDEISRVKRYKYPMSLIIFDIDFFKKVNDVYGHKVGDEVIIEYTKFIASLLRDEDTFCRIGGEEFIIILPHINRSGAFKVAEKLRSKVEHHLKILPITMSFGVVEYIMGEESENIFHRADTALYAAKEAGRNRVKIG